MKILFRLLPLLLVLSCQKNEDFTSIEVLTPDPTELNSVEIRGQVVHTDASPITFAKVQLYHQGETVAETLTDWGGYYSFPPGTVPLEKVMVSASRSRFLTNWQRINSREGAQPRLPLLEAGVEGLQSEAISVHDSLVRLTGIALDEAGTPQPNVHLLLYHEGLFLGLALTDEAGQFALLTRAAHPLNLIAGDPCHQALLGPIALPSFSADEELPPLSGPLGGTGLVQFSGQALNCEGQALGEGFIACQYGPAPTQRARFPVQMGGQFEFALPDCKLETGASIAIVAYDAQTQQSGKVEIAYSGAAQVDAGSIQTCGNGLPYFQLQFDGQVFELQGEWTVYKSYDGNGEEIRNLAYSSALGNCLIKFAYAEDTGVYELLFFSFTDYAGGVIHSRDGNGTVRVESLASSHLSGTFSGLGSITVGPPYAIPFEGVFSIPL